jgi:PKD repeat protein
MFHQSPVINIAGNGRYPVTLTISGSNVTTFSTLAILADGALSDFVGAELAPANMANARVTFENIMINTTPVRNSYSNYIVARGDPNTEGYIRASLWNAWGSRWLNTNDVTQITMGDGSFAFGLPGGVPINSVTMELVITGMT